MKRILVLLTLAVGLMTLDAVAQPPGGGGGGGGMGMGRNNPEFRTKFMFGQFCFDLNATDAQVAKALPIFRDAIAKQRAIMQKYPDPNEAAMGEMKQVQTDLETKVKALLTPEQQQKLAEMEAQQQQRRERFQGGGGSGGPGGGPPR